MASSLVINHLAYGSSGRGYVTALYDTSVYGSSYKDWTSIYGYSGSPAPYSGHGGLDAKCYSGGVVSGAPIYSIFPGKVSKIYSNSNNTYYGGSGSGEGTGVKIDSSVVVNGVASLVSLVYCHMKSPYEYGADGGKGGIKVSLNQTIGSGTFLGYQGNTGNSSGEHLHISAYLNGSRVDPYPFITGEYSGYGVSPPGDTGSSTPSLTNNDATSSSSTITTHSCTGTESLSDIANECNVDIAAILRLNNLDESVVDSILPEGSVINVPKVGNGGNTSSIDQYYDITQSSTSDSLYSGSYDYNPTGNFSSYFRLLHFSKDNNEIGNVKFWIPCTPDDVEERIDAQYSDISFIGRSSPYVVYNNTGARNVSFSFYMHRDMVPNEPDYVDVVLNALTSALYPIYKLSSGNIIPPSINFVMGDTVSLTGVLTSVNKTWGWPVINNRHMSCTVSVQMMAVHESLISAKSVYHSGSKI